MIRVRQRALRMQEFRLLHNRTQITAGKYTDTVESVLSAPHLDVPADCTESKCATEACGGLLLTVGGKPVGRGDARRRCLIVSSM